MYLDSDMGGLELESEMASVLRNESIGAPQEPQCRRCGKRAQRQCTTGGRQVGKGQSGPNDQNGAATQSIGLSARRKEPDHESTYPGQLSQGLQRPG